MAKTVYTGNLIESTGNEKFRGIIKGLTPPNKKGFGFVDVPAKDGKKAYRRIKFHVQTSNDNSPLVELMGCPKEYAYAYSKTEGKSMKVEWVKRFNPLPKGYELMLPEFDFIKKLNEEFKDGDPVVLIGDKPRFSAYDNPKSGKIEEQSSNNIKSVYPCTDKIDFDAEDFKEEATFAEDIVVRDFMTDEKAGKAYLYAYVIGYGGKFNSATFTLDLVTTDKTFLKNMKTLKFGDFIRINGVVQYKTLKKSVVVDGWGTAEDVAEKPYKALEITGADGATLFKKRYKIADFAETQADKATAIFNGNITAAPVVAETIPFSTGTKENVAPVESVVLPFNI